MADPQTPETADAGVDAAHPWLGLLSFKEEHRGYFFGRDAEITEILDRIQENALTILFSQSGLGKSSLLGAGVVPRLQTTGYSPVLFRLDYGAGESSLLQQTRDALRRALTGVSWPEDADEITLWELFHRLPALLEAGTPPPVLLFDQLEEFFTLGRQDSAREPECEAWLEEIADLLQNRPPRTLEDRFADNRRLAREYDFARTSLRCVFSLREDYLSCLEAWKTRIPLLVQNRMALLELDGPQALDAVLGPASLSDPPLVSREVAGAIIRTVARMPADTPLLKIRAVPPLLSLLCEQLNIARLEAGRVDIDSEMVSDRSEDILHNFYEESFSILPESDREKVRQIVEDRMVTVGGHRHPVAREDAEAELALLGVVDAKEVFDTLIRRRLLTAEEQGGIPRLEITHDVLLPLLIRSRKERRDRMAKDAVRRKLADAVRKARKRRVLVSVMSVLTLLALAGAGFGWRSSLESIRQRDEARFNEGLGWMLRAEVAEERGYQYPGTLLFAAQAIGFDGFGRPEDAENPIRFISEKRDRREFQNAREWLTSRPAYLPVWSSATGGPTVGGIALSPGSRHLVIAAGDRVEQWDLATDDQPIAISSGRALVADVAYHPDGNKIAIAGMDEVKIWDVPNRTFIRSYQRSASALAYSPDGTRLAAAGVNGDLVLWKEEVESIIPSGQTVPASRIAFSGDNSVVAMAIPAAGVRVFFAQVGEPSHAWKPADTLPGDTATKADSGPRPPLDATAVALSSDGTLLAIGGREGMISIWNTASAAWVGEVSAEQRHKGLIRDICFRTDGRELASGSEDGFIKLWDLTKPSPRVVATLTGHRSGVTRVRYVAGQELLASAGDDGSAKLWNISGKSENSPDLFRYFDDEWYVFKAKPDSHPPEWGGRTGFVNLPHSSIIYLWQKIHGERGVFDCLMKSRDWAGAIGVLKQLPEDHGDVAARDLVEAIASEAKLAARSSRWNLFDLRISQMQQMTALEDPELLRLSIRKNFFGVKGVNFNNCEGMGLVWCPPGTFTMGSPASERNRAPRGEVQHQVTLTSGFWLGTHEVTQAQWLSVMGENPSRYRKAGTQAPVESINWSKAMAFCRKLTDLERARGAVPAGWEYSLPTKAQWEYACRAGTGTAHYFGEDRSLLHQHANFRDLSYTRGNWPASPDKPPDLAQDDGYEITAPVGIYKPNVWGLYDMYGNVMEWCRDEVDNKKPRHVLPGEIVHLIDPCTHEGEDRELRGGSWSEMAANCRSAKGYALGAATSNWENGMRIALVPIGRGQ